MALQLLQGPGYAALKGMLQDMSCLPPVRLVCVHCAVTSSSLSPEQPHHGHLLPALQRPALHALRPGQRCFGQLHPPGACPADKFCLPCPDDGTQQECFMQGS